MAALALQALSLGAEKIPDKAFHAVPGGYFRPPEAEKNRQRSSSRKKRDKMHENGERSDDRSDRHDRRDRHRHRRKSDDYSASESGSDTGEDTRRSKPQRPSRRNRRYTSSQNLERGYDSDGMTRDQYTQSRGMPPASQPSQGGQYFPPPPMHAFEDGADYRQDGQNAPATDGAYDRSPQFPPQGGAYYPQQASSGSQFGAPRPGSAASNDRYQPYSPQPQAWEPKRNSFNPSYTPHAGYADSYAAGYQQQYQPYHPPQAGPNQGALAVQPPAQQPDTGYSTALAPYNMPPPQSDPAMNGAYPTYVPPQDNWTPSRSPSRNRHRGSRRSKSRGSRRSYDDDSRSRSRSRSRDRSRDRHRGRDNDRSSKSRNRSRSMAAQAKEALKSNRDVASSALGVVAGGLIGNQMGRGNKFGTLAGAVLGGFGANLWEKQHGEKKQAKEKRHHSRHDQDVVREYYDERRRRRQQQDEAASRHNSTASRHSKYEQPQQRTRSARSVSETAFPSQERVRQPYARSSQAIHTPIPVKIPSPHVHFASLDRSERPRTPGPRARTTVYDAQVSRGLRPTTRDISTQTDFKPRPKDGKSSRQERKEFVKKKIEKELPGGEKVFATAKSIKRAARRGTWDGSVVEEVFMEMTGVSMGQPDYMKSNWKN